MCRLLRVSTTYFWITALITLICYNTHRTDFWKYRELLTPHVVNMERAPSDLSTWVQTHLGTLYESNQSGNEVEFEARFGSTFSDKALVYLNHEQISLDAFKTKIIATDFGAIRSTVEWKEIFETETHVNKDTVEGLVAGFFIVTRTMKFRIRAGPAQNLSYNSFSAQISRDPNGHLGSGKIPYRISQLFITSLARPAPIHLQGISKAEDTSISEPQNE
ncbi:hypothetical protein B0H34DRAFT_806824 [Crassisporium funariophilum]|nr:hypothetical protein B0H34DRAFT_806824 [Crassisporium funariophilum]